MKRIDKTTFGGVHRVIKIRFFGLVGSVVSIGGIGILISFKLAILNHTHFRSGYEMTCLVQKVIYF